MTLDEFRRFVTSESEAAASALERFQQAGDRDIRYAALLEYVQRKFLLYDTGCPTTTLLDMAEASVRRILSLTGGNIRAADLPQGCTGLDAPVTKKLLLIFALRSALDVPLAPDRIAEIETVAQLCTVLSAGCGPEAGHHV